MESSNSSLSNLIDIIPPSPVPFWPLGQGAYLLLVAIMISAALLIYLSLVHYKANQYRREGLNLLGDAVTVHDVSVVLKRVALAAFPREHVASLYGELWVRFLKETCSNCDLEELQSELENEAGQELVNTASFWISKHQVKHKG